MSRRIAALALSDRRLGVRAEADPAHRCARSGGAPAAHRPFAGTLYARLRLGAGRSRMSGRGDGAARIAAPDSARLDFFLAGGFGGAAILIRDSLDAPGGDMVRRFIPPPTLMWAALGRVALPNLPDTVDQDGRSRLRADIGNPVAWRLTFRRRYAGPSRTRVRWPGSRVGRAHRLVAHSVPKRRRPSIVTTIDHSS